MSDIETVAEILSRSKRTAVLTGAGISAESGIPTFRGLGGLWNGRDPMSLATPEAFASDPATVWEFYRFRRDLVARSEPNPGHFALAELGRRYSSNFTLITQNVDRLHQRAGSVDVLELHGNLFDVRCTGCRQTFDRDGVELPPLPRCDDCGALLRPAVVWFGESLPQDVWQRAERAVEQADALLVVGTSALVYPAAGLVLTAAEHGCPVIEINLETTALSQFVDHALLGKSGEILPQLLASLPA
ncbi:SIR2 family NAD-dependent protein deacylase [Singulisphaera sp. PoT]|uniref:SIR2 family NAD-dependent protein deacylase n=1 Tax=Singulisphaera sp. PoT TaxID=3411797 RepID=UPI003BF54EBB